MDNRERFGSRIKRLREKVGMSQTELGNAVGVALQTVFRWEAGIRSPRMEEVARIAAALNVSESELLHGPKDTKIKITLSWNREDVEGEIDMNDNGFALFLDTNGAIGIKGAANFTSREALKEAIARIATELEEGFDFQVRRGRIKEGE